MKLAPPPISLRVLLSHARVVWKHWNVQSMVLTSFIIQLVLILLAPFRKHTSNTVIVASVWLAYLLADWVAIQSIGLISNPLTTTASDADGELYAFWTQFLLLHLGGPDTITALALEDNELWLRTGLHLAVQIYGSLGILVRTLGNSQSSLWLPTLLMFAAGVIKYMERVSSLFHGRFHKLSTLPLPSVSRPPSCGGNNTDAELVRDAFFFLKKFKGLLYRGKELHLIERDGFCLYLSKRTPEDAFRVLEIQFNFVYDALYTKTVLIYTELHWKALRLAVTLLQVGCVVTWVFFTDKDRLTEYNIRITYTLLVGAIAVDVFTFLRIQLLSDWTIALRVADASNSAVLLVYNMILSARKRTWGRYLKRENAPFWARFRRALFRRWSESIPQLSLVSLSMAEKSNKVIKILGLEKSIKQNKYVSRKWFSSDLWDFLYKDLINNARELGGVENIGKVKGGWACSCLMNKYSREMISIPIICDLLDIHGQYYVILIRWHIITEICYHSQQLSRDNDSSESGNKINLQGKEGCNYKEICKTISDYLMYLLAHRHDMLSVPTSANEKLQDTYEQMKSVFTKYMKSEPIAKVAAERYIKPNP